LEVRTLNSPRVPRTFSSRAEWEARRERLREQILSAAGLWPMPGKTPLNAQVFDRIEEERFTVEKVYFESYPRFYCTGNLYRPRGGSAKPPFPAVLSPHGHWLYGRLEQNPGDLNGCAVPQRCMNLAMQGYVVFAYDMVGFNDSFQMQHPYGYDKNDTWGFAPETRRQWLWGVSQLGLQLWNSIRAVDFISSLADVDPDRIGATGASSGGTQTFLLAAVDDRVKVSAPVNMISHFMQGGCICENAPNLRIDTDNMEIAALSAPRPLLMVSTTGDWTRDSKRIEYPAVASIYELLRARERVAHVQFTNGHNYNRPSREAVYRFFAKWLPRESRPDADQLSEQDGLHIDPGEMLVFSRRLPPSDALDTQGLINSVLKISSDQLSASRPKTSGQIKTYREQFEPAYRTALMAEAPSTQDLRWWHVESPATQGKGYEKLIIGRQSVGDRIPGLLARPVGRASGAALIVHPGGAQAALGAAANPAPLARVLLKRGIMLLSIDTFQTGAALDASRKTAAEFFPCYNRTDDMQRVQDILTALAWLEAAWKPARISVVGQGLAGLWSLLARPLFPKAYAAAADAAGFDASQDASYLERLYIPLLRRAGDFESAAWLAPPSPLLLHNTGGRFPSEAFQQAYSLQNAGGKLRFSAAVLPDSDIADWLAQA
jgi:dienelactone hydrolase